MHIQWPKKYSPANCAVYVQNELQIPAPCERVWPWLIRADLWPQWYVNARNVEYQNQAERELRLGTQFRWKTFGVKVDSTVLEFVPFERIGWNAIGIGVDAYHAWLLEKNETGCLVLTEETQNGFLARIGHCLAPNRMHHYHQLWLESLQAQAQKVGVPN